LNVKTNANKPLYVVDKNFAKNELVVGYDDDPLLYKKEATVSAVNWVGQTPKFPLKCEVRIRHRQELQACNVEQKNNNIIIHFIKKQRAITPGQFAVFYFNSICLGGGTII